uniref:BTB domain-containing protein n=1 Tax=Caenorhabditis tropicalis TaxID=1561998 RepID=A0A1I7TI52_9PELO
MKEWTIVKDLRESIEQRKRCCPDCSRSKFFERFANHSDYFHSLQKEKKKCEIEGLQNPDVFQEFFEVFYGGIVGNEENFEGVLPLLE